MSVLNMINEVKQISFNKQLLQYTHNFSKIHGRIGPNFCVMFFKVQVADGPQMFF